MNTARRLANAQKECCHWMEEMRKYTRGSPDYHTARTFLAYHQGRRAVLSLWTRAEARRTRHRNRKPKTLCAVFAEEATTISPVTDTSTQGKARPGRVPIEKSSPVRDRSGGGVSL